MSIDLKLSDDCIDKFDEMKMKSAYRYIIYSIQKDSEVIIILFIQFTYKIQN